MYGSYPCTFPSYCLQSQYSCYPSINLLSLKLLLLSKMEYTNNSYTNTVPIISDYWNNSLLKPRHFYHTGFEDSLENIVFKEDPEKEKDILGRVFSDKNKTLKATIKALFNEIMLRERLDSFLLYKISEDICRQHSHFEQVKTLMQFNYSNNLLTDLP